MIISRKRYERDIERARYEQDRENDRIRREEEYFARTYNLEKETERLSARIERLETEVHKLMVISEENKDGAVLVCGCKANCRYSDSDAVAEMNANVTREP